MRARTVIRKAYIFDFDDTLVKTKAKIKVYKHGVLINQLTPSDYNSYKHVDDETLDFSDFSDPRLIMAASRFKMWPALNNINNAILMGRSISSIYILTARTDIAQSPIHKYLRKEGITTIPYENILTISGDGSKSQPISVLKETKLRQLSAQYDEVIFFDDSKDNIELAAKIPGIKTRLIEKNI